MSYAEVAVNANVHKTFHYHIPEQLEERLTEGHMVKVAFRTGVQPAIVVGIWQELPSELADIQTKPILELLDPRPMIDLKYIDLAWWLSETYLTPLGMCLWLMIPAGITGKSKKSVHLLDESAIGRTDSQKLILDLLKAESPRDFGDLEAATGFKTLAAMLKDLEAAQVIQIVSELSTPSVNTKKIRTVIRTMPDDEVLIALAELKKAKKQREIFAYIARFDYPVDVPEVYAATGAGSADLNNLATRGLIQFGTRIEYRDSLADRDFIPQQAPPLAQGQQAVWEVIREAILNQAKHKSEKYSRRRKKLPTPTPSPLQWGGDVKRSDTGVGTEGWLHTYTNLEQWHKLKVFARQMRHEPTPAEDMLWEKVRGKRLGGHKFRRQHPVGFFITDFCCVEAHLIIEVDGGIHAEQAEYDELRQAYLESLGFQILRFDNAAILSNIEAVMQVIDETLADILQNAKTQETRKTSSKFLLHGVTGSGKTEIYLHAIAETLAQGKQALFLVPEIALTPQTIRRVAERFPEQVAVVHGSLSAGERYDTWRRARDAEVGVIVGTRSALFTPLPDLGLIILDEEHDHSYKQAPPILPPYYHARAVAEELSEAFDATLILGSATPDIETYYRAQKGDLTYLHLPDRIMGHRQRVKKQAQERHIETRYLPDEGEAMTIDLPPVDIVDMRDELRAGNTSMFSRSLQKELAQTLKRGEQAILFLNRRGQSTYVFCRDCGYVLQCANCDTPMTYHREGESLRCHHCGKQAPNPTACPQCQSKRIRYFGAGTQQVEAELQRLFPEARAVRWDADTAHKPDLHEAILGRFINGEADVMVGTQIVTKGLDLPLVTLVGVVSADHGLALPDFRARERAFQLLTQVAGRAGRGLLGGRVILQTYQPEHMSIVTAAKHDYFAFYEQEIAARRDLGYPPFRRLARLLVQNTHPIEAQREIESAAQWLRQQIEKLQLTDTSLIGAAPCFFSRIDKYYRWQLLIRSVDPLTVLQDLALRQGWYLDIDPVDLL